MGTISREKPLTDAPLKVGDHPNALARRTLARQLHGDGIEFGPGCHPIPLGPFVERVRYCDKLNRGEFADVFPEAAAEIDQFPDPLDFHMDFEREDFPRLIGESSADFLVASHLLEHLVNPILFLERCHRLLRDDGLLYLVVPDPRSNRDRDRRRTRLADVVERYQKRAVELPDDAIVQFIREAEQPTTPFGPRSPDFEWRIEQHRRRSIHVNVWIVDDIVEILEYVGRSLRLPWELVDGLICATEIVLLLRRSEDVSTLDRYPGVLSRIWFDSYRQMVKDDLQPRIAELEQLLLSVHDRLLILDERGRETQRFVRRIKHLVEALPGGRSFAKWLGKSDAP